MSSKSVERAERVFEAQLLTYLRVSGIKTGLLINFNSRLLRMALSALFSNHSFFSLRLCDSVTDFLFAC